MSELQKEATDNFTSSRVFHALNSVFDSMPDRFKTGEICRAAKLKGPSVYAAIAVLNRSFACSRNAAGIWKKDKPIPLIGPQGVRGQV